MHTKLFYQAIIIFLTLGLTSCIKDKVRNIPQVSTSDINLEIKRFDQDLLSLDTSKLKTEVEALALKYPIFLKGVFLPRILPVLQDPKIFEQYIKAPPVRKLLDTCNLVFQDFSDYESELKQAFAFYKHYVPNRTIPQIVTYTSEYSLGNFTYADSLLGIGLDFFLGKDYPLYNPKFFPNYIKRTMSPEYLVSKTIQTLVTDLAGTASGGRLLDHMVHNGKVLYMLDHLLPYESDSIKLEYTQTQVDWCAENELQIWAFLLDEELLYSTKYKDFQKLIDHSPNSPGMPETAPGRTANWIGWQIVKAYMNRFPETTWEALIELDDAQSLLNRSKYKPGR